MADAQKLALGKCDHDGVCSNCCLHVAVGFGDLDCVKELISAGAEVNRLWDKRSHSGMYSAAPLHEAASFDTRFCSDADISQIIDELVAAGADVNIKNSHGQTALQLAVVNGCPTVVKALMGHNAKVSTADADGNSPLHSVALSDVPQLDDHRSEIADQLLSGGANARAKNKQGQTPAEIARMKGRIESIPALMSEEERKELEKREERERIELEKREERKRIVNQRRSQRKCIMCGKPLGFFARLCRQEKHSGCLRYRT